MLCLLNYSILMADPPIYVEMWEFSHWEATPHLGTPQGLITVEQCNVLIVFLNFCFVLVFTCVVLYLALLNFCFHMCCTVSGPPRLLFSHVLYCIWQLGMQWRSPPPHPHLTLTYFNFVLYLHVVHCTV